MAVLVLKSHECAADKINKVLDNVYFLKIFCAQRLDIGAARQNAVIETRSEYYVDMEFILHGEG